MKKIAKSYIKNTVLFFTLFLMGSCDLKLQEPYDFQPELPDEITFKDQTAWDWIQKQTTPAGTTVFSIEKFDYLIQAIKQTGLEAEFSKAGDKRTFLLLNNAAFLGTGKIIPLLTGSATGTLDKADKTRLTNVLKYHIVDAYVDQIVALPVFGAQYEFKTLLDGPNGVIKFTRNERLSITINSAADLPTTKKSAGVYRHNYIFGNGIGHIMNVHVGITTF
jgi:uncharacterized surface protein with fasciclin (FAS1) repeats